MYRKGVDGAMKCGVCGLELENGICPVCGFDVGLDWESYPTLAAGEPTLPLARRRERWRATAGDALRCARCGGLSFSIFPGKGKARCCSCGSMTPLIVQGTASGNEERPRQAAPTAPGGNSWRCSCGFRNSASSRFCPNCGLQRPFVQSSKPPQPVSDDTWLCTCGARNSIAHRYCSVCDRPRRGGTGLKITLGDTWLCPCGTRNSSTSRYCSACDRPRR